MKLTLQLVTCGRCGKPRGLTHTCHGRSRRPARAKLAPKARVTSKCGSCGKPVTNPLTHVCVVRKSAPKRGQPAKPAPKKPPRVKVVRPAGPKKEVHPYAACRASDCPRVACVAYREGYVDGLGDGIDAAEAAR